MALAGDFERGLDVMERAIELNPYYPGHLHAAPCLKHYYAREYEKALTEAVRFGTPDLFWDPLLRGACLGQLGGTEEAGKAIGDLLRLRPDFPERHAHLLRCFIVRDEWCEHLLDGLRKAGLRLPEDSLTP